MTSPLHKTSLVVHTCDVSTQQVGAGSKKFNDILKHAGRHGHRPSWDTDEIMSQRCRGGAQGRREKGKWETEILYYRAWGIIEGSRKISF